LALFLISAISLQSLYPGVSHFHKRMCSFPFPLPPHFYPGLFFKTSQTCRGFPHLLSGLRVPFFLLIFFFPKAPFLPPLPHFPFFSIWKCCWSSSSKTLSLPPQAAVQFGFSKVFLDLSSVYLKTSPLPNGLISEAEFACVHA